MEGDVASLTEGQQLVTSVPYGRHVIVFRVTLLGVDIMESAANIAIEVEVVQRVQGVS